MVISPCFFFLWNVFFLNCLYSKRFYMKIWYQIKDLAPLPPGSGAYTKKLFIGNLCCLLWMNYEFNVGETSECAALAWVNNQFGFIALHFTRSQECRMLLHIEKNDDKLSRKYGFAVWEISILQWNWVIMLDVRSSLIKNIQNVSQDKVESNNDMSHHRHQRPVHGSHVLFAKIIIAKCFIWCLKYRIFEKKKNFYKNHQI